MVEVTKIGNKTIVMDGKILSLFRKGSLLRQMYYGGYEDFDGANGGVWKKYINIPIKTVPLEYAQYLIEIDNTNVSVYNAKGDLKAQASIASEFWSLVRSDGFDIRAFDHLFNQLWFWVEMFDYTNKKAKIWVKLPENSEELNIAFGNEKASESSYKDSENTFEFFDDFERSELDTSKWTTRGNGTYSIANSIIEIDANTNDNFHVTSKQTFERPIILSFKFKFGYQSSSTYVYKAIGFDQGDKTEVGSNHVSILSDVRDTELKHNIVIGGTVYRYDLSPAIDAFDTWYIGKVIWANTFTKAIANSSSSESSHTPSPALYVDIWVQGNADKAYVDYIYVCKYADPADFGTPCIVEF